MNGIHDLGGMHGFGPIAPTPSELPFKADWEKHTMALFVALAGGGYLNGDEFRHAMERMPPSDYLSTSYYEHWLFALELLVVEKGIITEAELGRAKDNARSVSDAKNDCK